MNVLSTPFDSHTLSAASAGQWSPSSSATSVPSLPAVSESGDTGPLVTPWDDTTLPPSYFPVVNELPSL